MGESISHTEARVATEQFLRRSNIDDLAYARLRNYIDQQESARRAASGVKVVRIVDVTKKYECCKATQLLPGQSLAIIERRAEAAKDASGVRDGHVRLPDGREVRVLGTLPMTVDGAIIGAGADVRVFWSRDDLADKEWEGWPVASVGAGHSESNHFIWADLCGNGPVATNVLYSTREAAEAAAGEGARMCYPFSTDTCTRPACTCRDEKAAARRAGGEESPQ